MRLARTGPPGVQSALGSRLSAMYCAKPEHPGKPQAPQLYWGRTSSMAVVSGFSSTANFLEAKTRTTESRPASMARNRVALRISTRLLPEYFHYLRQRTRSAGQNRGRKHANQEHHQRAQEATCHRVQTQRPRQPLLPRGRTGDGAYTRNEVEDASSSYLIPCGERDAHHVPCAGPCAVPDLDGRPRLLVDEEAAGPLVAASLAGREGGHDRGAFAGQGDDAPRGALVGFPVEAGCGHAYFPCRYFFTARAWSS